MWGLFAQTVNNERVAVKIINKYQQFKLVQVQYAAYNKYLQVVLLLYRSSTI